MQGCARPKPALLLDADGQAPATFVDALIGNWVVSGTAGLKLVPLWDASIAGNSSTHFTKTLALQ